MTQQPAKQQRISMHMVQYLCDENFRNIIKNKEAKEEKKKLKLQNKTNKNVNWTGKRPAKKRFNATQILDESSEDEGNETFGAIGIYPNCKEENYLQEESEDDSDTATKQAIVIDEKT